MCQHYRHRWGENYFVVLTYDQLRFFKALSPYENDDAVQRWAPECL